jgi:hypothetical protein
MIHPNRWTSFFGQYYIITKLVIERLVHESAFLNSEIKRLKEKGIEFPPGEGPMDYGPVSYGKTKSIKVQAFQAKVYLPDTKYAGEYPKAKETEAALIDAYNTRKRYQKILKKLRFMTRATEYAHSKVPDSLPSWIKGVRWQDDFKIPPKGRTRWQRLPLFQDEVGEFSIALLRRWYEKSTRVDINYK